ncbi:hypothetical protein SAMN02927900_05579 [Rhizobium mongolense subsp. loessense]|uniref:Uncharacterized protein n=1 Tax=Rhizobium mongolense subsp. loessense TaxID=158890 RepID=A0A1G4TTP2_9HYPH|nr:hypothetical protein [Rhizobium mongolense]SCW84627.1 hypothetical protein SAMN02927900_05579 [Rhizobium mongolense subsp. loessense]
MIPQWLTILNRTHPPGAVKSFSAAAFELTAAINLRLALRLIKPTAECLAKAEEVYERAKLYCELREAGSATTVNAERQLADALKLLTAEMRACDPGRSADAILAGHILTDERTNSFNHARRPEPPDTDREGIPHEVGGSDNLRLTSCWLDGVAATVATSGDSDDHLLAPVHAPVPKPDPQASCILHMPQSRQEIT